MICQSCASRQKVTRTPTPDARSNPGAVLESGVAPISMHGNGHVSRSRTRFRPAGTEVERLVGQTVRKITQAVMNYSVLPCHEDQGQVIYVPRVSITTSCHTPRSLETE